MSAVRVAGMSVTFPRGGARLDRVDLEIGAGEQVLLAGPSGCGKSTLLGVLTGVVPQAVAAHVTGDVAVLDRDPRTTPIARHALDVGWLGQDPASGTCLPTVVSDVALPLENRGVPAAEIGPRVRRALAAVGAAHLAGRRAAQLSGGEQQRVALAAVLVGDPSLLLLDEPTSMLDPAGAALVHEVLAREAGRRTVIMTGHRPPEGPWRPTREVVLGSGRVVHDGDPTAPGRASPGAARPEGGPAGRAGPCRRTGPRWSGAGRTAGDPVLRLRGAGWAQGGRVVVRGVAATLRAGQVTAVVGGNGSGKSSLLLGLAGFLDGEGDRGAGTGPPPALVLQRPEQQLLARTVRDEVAYGLRARQRRGRRAARAREDEVAATVDAALDRVGLRHLAAADPFRLSGGEQRRLAVAAMAVLDRPVLLLDEPTCGLDDVATSAVLAVVDGLTARGTAVVLATHDLPLARGFADQVLVLRDGDVLASGHPALLDDAGLLREAGLLAGEPAGVAPLAPVAR